jgi:hypothetical protein
MSDCINEYNTDFTSRFFPYMERKIEAEVNSATYFI